MMRGSAVVAGALTRHLDAGGHVWALLHWVLGFKALGWRVTFLDRIDPAPGSRRSARVGRLVELMHRMGISEDFSLDLGCDEEPVGLGRFEVRQRMRDSDLLVNIMGYLKDESLLAEARRRVFLDIDPGFGQMWRALGLCDSFGGHERFVTVGSRLGREGCTIPTCGLQWLHTLPPVDLHLWPSGNGAGPRYTSVGAWRGPYDAVQWDGVRYGLRAHEFRRFADLPSRIGGGLEVALDMAPEDASDAALLRRGGWILTDPAEVAGDSDSYRAYVTSSRGEFAVAKEMYVRSRSGWFSDRTAVYLAAGRPAIVQDTGLAGAFPIGEGLLVFSDPEQAVETLREVESDWTRHSRAARAFAEAYLDSRKVLGQVVEAIAA
jgi:hypothetical protein